ncbi:MAG TPA: cytochrome C oxidase subunit IV family protein [Gemmataceae bacterium]|jgi:caa(3)-type oxidase subunit IV|nr:cytochrome C oxidase subunit IV family protein [Gemmataceae bacterium]
MTEPAHPDTHALDAAHAEHHEAHISDKTFLKVFGFLLCLTAATFAANQFLGERAKFAAFIIIAIIAICKALLVVVYFMHLVLDIKKVYLFIVPVMILAPVIVIVLWPDIVLAWRLGPPQ